MSSWFGCWRAYLCYVLDWVLAGKGAPHALHSVCMLRPNQAGGLQGSLIVRRDILAANDLGNGSGWKQSKQNWALPAVAGQCSRTECSCLCGAELAPLHFSFLASPPHLSLSLSHTHSLSLSLSLFLSLSLSLSRFANIPHVSLPLQ